MKKLLATLVIGCLIAPVMAQDRVKATPSTTTDNTVIVAPVPPEPIPLPPRPVRNYVIASPRVSLQQHPPLLQPIVAPNDHDCRTIGAAHNFHRRSTRMLLLRDKNLYVKLDDETEGVWHPKSCGFLGAGLFLYQYDFHNRQWRKLGNDMRFAHGCGPNKGQGTDIGVMFEPDHAGIYILSACAISFALPTDPDGTDPTNLRKWLQCGDVDVSESYIFMWAVDTIQPYHKRWLSYADAERIDTRDELAKEDIAIELVPGVRAVEAEAILGLEAEPAPTE
jgi:hypothetical protein